jgi:hypothetical protein
VALTHELRSVSGPNKLREFFNLFDCAYAVVGVPITETSFIRPDTNNTILEEFPIDLFVGAVD